jgi:O-antigen/teichoic acid export membrane protein
VLVAVAGVVPDVGDVVVRRDGAVGVICEEVLVVDPAANAPRGKASETPTEAMAAASLSDFTGLGNVVERAISHRPDELPRILHGFPKSLPAATVQARMRARISAPLERLRRSDTSKAAALAGAMIANNVIALIASVVFARLLTNYGALAALISYLVILTVAGQAVQVATAREGVLGHLGSGEELLQTLERWARALAIFTTLATIVSILVRQPIADAVGVPRQGWAAAAGIPAGCLYLGLCTLRGALQGIGDYRTVGLSLIGEQGARLISGAILAVAGLGIAGAYLGSLISYIAMSAYCSLAIYKRLAGPTHTRWRVRRTATGAFGFARLVWSAAVPIAALGIIQLLQNIDLITAKHRFSDKVASSYAVAAVAGKVLIWVAMGASFYLVPETSRLRSEGGDTRPVLLKSLGIVVVCAVPCMLIFAFAAHPLLAAVFGKDKAIASGSLLPLGAAFTVLAATYLAVQYMLALKRVWFLLAIGLVAAIEPVLLLQASKKPASFATVVLFVQLIGAAVTYVAALARRPVLTAPAAGAAEPGSE